MNTMERRNEERMTKLIKEHRSELKIAQSNNNDGGGHKGNRTDSGGNRDHKKSRCDTSFNERKKFKSKAERWAINRLKWEKRLEGKLDKPGSDWANKQERHDPDMINWGGYCHTHGYDPIERNHDSSHCNKDRNGYNGPAYDHDKTATQTNRKGCREDNKPL